ncbi:ParB N-terminal domain-containing protein [Streptomyces sp. NRRL B-24572]|uniref:ParB N-terminal domain-containing protein n=1 Tax=Streptomyces sp. NRRL B-24572 TaxID=1962156 RepID=UPI0015C52057|nr:ParB/RepB/Spo0J family partition protein [Streptomyces sp. NRRL B-24572]
MLSQDELLDLADSIKAEGQHRPIVLDSDGVLLDGRNRLAACEIAGVEPRFTTYTGNNPTALILSNNVFRRHISKGQQAMITAMACSVSGHSLRDLAKLHGLSRSRLSAANVVLKYSRELAEQVRIGAVSLDNAYNAVSEGKARAAALQEKYDRLRELAPDLAEQVTESQITLDDAAAALHERLETERLRQYVINADSVRLADGDTTPSLAELVERGDITWPEARQRAEEFAVHRRDTIQRSRQALHLIAENWTAIQDLAARPNTPYARDILDGLASETRSLAQALMTLA